MNTTGIFTVHSYDIVVKKMGEPIHLMPFGDVHRSSPMCDLDEWNKWLEKAKKTKNALFLGMGDYDDLCSSSERLILGNPLLHDSTKETLEDSHKKMTDRFAKEIGFMRGKLIGFVEGNHYTTFYNGTTSTQRLCENLGTKYLGVSSFIRLSFGVPTSSKRCCLDIWAHHGKGASRMVGSSISRVEQMAETAEADIYIMGHDHKKGALPGTKFALTREKKNIRLKQRKMFFVRSGSFLKSYENKKASYVVDAAMNPSSLGAVTISLIPRRSNDEDGDRFYIDMEATV